MVVNEEEDDSLASEESSLAEDSFLVNEEESSLVNEEDDSLANKDLAGEAELSSSATAGDLLLPDEVEPATAATGSPADDEVKLGFLPPSKLAVCSMCDPELASLSSEPASAGGDSPRGNPSVRCPSFLIEMRSILHSCSSRNCFNCSL